MRRSWTAPGHPATRALAASALALAATVTACTASHPQPARHTTPPTTATTAPASTAPPATAPPATDAGSPTATSPTSPTAPPTTPAPSVPADVPRHGPNMRTGETPPVMPAAATRHTPAGAQAFARFFIRTIDWGYATTSSAYMRHYYQPTCTECRNVRAFLDNAARDGQHYVGARILRVAAGRARHVGGGQLQVVLTIDVNSEELVSSSGHFVSGDAAHLGFHEQVGVRWHDRSWAVARLVPLG